MFVTPAYAQASAAGAQGAGGAVFLQFAPLLFIFVIFWFLVFRPQQQRMKEQKSRIEAAKKGDSVVTGGGLIGKITKVDGDIVEVEIAQGVKVRAVKATLSDITPLGVAKPAND
jgi:preprotein translocase subunit YajC